MPQTCCVVGCKSGYRSTKPKTANAESSTAKDSIKETSTTSEVQKISYLSFPRDQELREKWIRAIPKRLDKD